MKLIKRTEPRDKTDYSFGDYLWWDDYICEIFDEDFKDNQILPLYNMCLMNPWKFMDRLGIEIKEMKKKAMYSCPYSEMEFCAVMPFAILSKDIEKYRKGDFKKSVFDMTWDDDWTRSMSFKGDGENRFLTNLSQYKVPDMNIYEVQMGHGYTFATLHTDGDADMVEAKVGIDNGDWLVIKTWMWFNK